MDPIREVSSESTGEMREEIAPGGNVAVGGSNTTMDTFTQMMAAVTKLIQGGQVQPQTNSSGNVQVDKNLKLFQDMRPPLFSGAENPMEAENWLMRVEKILDGMNCPQERRVSLATFALDGEAERWWRGQLQEKFGGMSTSLIGWKEFVIVFKDWFVPLSARRQMQDRFIQLVQGDLNVMQYEAEFTMLSRYAPQLIPNAEEKCHRFLSGLRDAIRQPLIPLGLDDYSALVERARRLEIDFEATQKRRDQQKRKSVSEVEHTINSEGSLEKKSKSSVRGGSNTMGNTVEACAKCGRSHRGECLMGTNTCYRCRQFGHTAKFCPTYNQNPAISSSQQTMVGRPRVTESTVSAPSQGQRRQNVQPRVYSLIQQEADEQVDAEGDKEKV